MNVAHVRVRDVDSEPGVQAESARGILGVDVERRPLEAAANASSSSVSPITEGRHMRSSVGAGLPRADRCRMRPLTWRCAVTMEFVLWSIIGLICAVGGVLLLAAGWSLVHRRPDR